MTEKQKQVLTCLINGKTYQQIANEIGTSRENIYKLAMHAIKRPSKSWHKGHYPKLQDYIDEQVISIRELSKQTGIKYGTLRSMISDGRTPRYETIARLSEYTGISVEELMVKNNGAEIEEDIQAAQ